MELWLLIQTAGATFNAVAVFRTYQVDGSFMNQGTATFVQSGQSVTVWPFLRKKMTCYRYPCHCSILARVCRST